MKNSVLAIAAAIVTTTTMISSPVQAGGKFLQLPGGHGSFRAVPTRKAGSSRASHHSNAKRAAILRAKKKAAIAAKRRKLLAAKKAKIAAAKRAKIAAAKKARIAAVKKQKIAKQRRLAALKSAAKRRAAARREANKTVDQAQATEDPIQEQEVAGENKVVATTTAQSEILNNSDDIEDTELNNAGEGQCKKYIPSAGLTISVPCAD